MSRTATKKRPSRRISGHDPIRLTPITEIHPSPENDKLYRPVDPRDPEVIGLAESIRKNGVQEPIIVTADRFIISGHRRYAAAKLAGLVEVPVRVKRDVHRINTPDVFMRLLREMNRQRVKTLAEKLREEAASANPESAYQSLIEHRYSRSKIDAKVNTLKLGDKKTRSAITAAKVPMLNAVIGVLNDRRDFWPLSDRQIHYALLNDPPLLHASKRARYRNDQRCYKSLVDLLTRARVEGRIPFSAIEDATRPVVLWGVHRDAGAYIGQELNNFLKGYWRDLQQSQENHVELLVEKNTVLPIIRPVAEQYCLPLTSGRGYCSLPPRHAISERFKKSGKEKLVLLIVSDFDPDGQTIATSFARSMRDDFGVDVEAVKVALTADQVKQYQLPPVMKAKAGCSTREAFVEAHGDDVFEVEALPPKDLQTITRAAIDSVLDLQAFNYELAQEKADAAKLEPIRRGVIDFVGTINVEGEQ